MMTTGYLWTGQFEEAKKAIEEGQPHSMELDGESLDGHWATDNNLGVEFFIINDATFSKLCILGDDVEPCYEGSSVTSPQVSSNFSKQEYFEQTLFTMMQELKDTLNNEGGLNMSKEQETDTKEVEEFEKDSDQNVDSEIIEENEDVKDDFVKKEKEEEKSDDKDDDDSKDDEESDDTAGDTKEDEDKKKKPNTQHSVEEFEKLENELESLRAEIEELRDFKLNVEMQEKQKLVDSYFMLSDEDKAEVVANLANYSLDEIKAKLAIIYVEQNVDFNRVEDQSKDDSSPALSFSLEEETGDEVLTDLQRALRNAKNN